MTETQVRIQCVKSDDLLKFQPIKVSRSLKQFHVVLSRKIKFCELHRVKKSV